ncbi:archease [Halobellus rarus]|uniref:Archease n=1 Tax=Halobellus rarus TaxID=1126237 RepID=A0ABD6CKG3_9EURY|nr:archease [Halobellus rarus]
MPFELREHTADIAVEATASTLSTLFGSVADGLAAASCDAVAERTAGSPADESDGAEPTLPEIDAETFEISVASEGLEALLFDYLDELIYERDVRGVLPVENRVRIETPEGASGDDEPIADVETDGADVEWRLEAAYRGIPLSEIDAREVKAVTYSEMRVERTETGGWVAYVVFDV